MRDRPRALVIGAELEEARVLRGAAAGLIGSETEVLALVVRQDADAKTHLSSELVEVYDLTDGDARSRAPIERIGGGSTDVWKVVVDAAHRHDAGVIVIAGHRQTWLQRVMAGSTARDLLKHSDIPILAMPASRLSEAPTSTR